MFDAAESYDNATEPDSVRPKARQGVITHIAKTSMFMLDVVTPERETDISTLKVVRKEADGEPDWYEVSRNDRTPMLLAQHEMSALVGLLCQAARISFKNIPF